MFWQLHYEADDLTLLEDYTACILQHRMLCSEDINKVQQAGVGLDTQKCRSLETRERLYKSSRRRLAARCW